MAQKDIGNKVPLHTLKKTEDVMKFYDDWGKENKYDKDMSDWNYTGPKETSEVFNKYANDKEIKIIVNDDGPGFPKDIIDNLGEPYIKSRSLELNSNSGLGLGTFLGKTLLEKQGAKLLFRRNNDLGGALVVISWNPKNLVNS